MTRSKARIRKIHSQNDEGIYWNIIFIYEYTTFYGLSAQLINNNNNWKRKHCELVLLSYFLCASLGLLLKWNVNLMQWICTNKSTFHQIQLFVTTLRYIAVKRALNKYYLFAVSSASVCATYLKLCTHTMYAVCITFADTFVCICSKFAACTSRNRIR